MSKLVLLTCCLLGAAAAQNPKIVSKDGMVTAMVNDGGDLMAMRAKLAGDETTVEDTSSNYDMITDILDNAEQSLPVKDDDIMSRVAAQKAANMRVNASIHTAQTALDELNSELATLLETLRTNRAKYQKALTSTKMKLAKRGSQMERGNAELLSKTEASIASARTAIAEMEAGIDGTVADVVDTQLSTQKEALDAKMATKSRKLKPMFSGGALDWGNGGSWLPLKNDRIEIANPMGYFTIDSEGFTVLKAGLYRINYWGIMNGGNCIGHSTVTVGGRQITNPGHLILNWGGSWDSMHVDQQWYVKEGQKVQILFSNCGHRWHRTSPGNVYSYNRVTFEYVGDLDQAKCKGPFCLGN